MSEGYMVGTDLGGTKILSGIFNRQGQLLGEILVPTEAEAGMDKIIARMTDNIEELLRVAGVKRQQLDAIVVGVPGPMNQDTGCLYHAPNLGCEDIFPGRLLQEHFSVPVWLDNDANLAALGEYDFGYPGRFPIMLYVTVSTGIGGGIVLEGEIFRGADGGAGEFGHMIIEPMGAPCRCGSRGCLETLASGTAIARNARELVAEGRGGAIARLAGGDPEAVTAHLVAEAAREGDREAQAILDGAFRYLGIGLANLVSLFNPHAIVIGGGLSSQTGLFTAARREIQARTFPHLSRGLQVLPAALGQRSVLMGCLALGRRKVS